jgi:hypothetical protein
MRHGEQFRQPRQVFAVPGGYKKLQPRQVFAAPGGYKKRRCAATLAVVLAGLATTASQAGALAAPGKLQPIMLGVNYSPSMISCSSARCIIAGATFSGPTFIGALDPLTGAFRVLHVAKASGVDLLALTCPTSSACLGVGHAATGFAEPISATTGALGPLRAVPGTFGLDAIACSGAGKCWAAGYEGTYPNFTSVFAPVEPSGATGGVSRGPKGEAVDVACPSTSCLGLVVSATASDVAVLRGGTIVALHPIGRSLHLGCETAAHCFAVGFGEVVPFNGATGVAGPGMALPYKQAQGITCPSPTECVVAGYTSFATTAKAKNASAVSTLANGHVAATRAIQLPEGAGVAALSCSSPTSCWVVGTGTKGGFILGVPVAP